MQTNNSGVVLVMVLGLLSVMLLLAVTFAITMRTERLAAGNAADTVRARKLAQIGLARVLNQLASDLGPTGLYSTSGGIPVGKAYPSWTVTNSYTNTDGVGFARFPTNIYLLRGEATNYVPRILWDAATNADFTSSSNHWLAVESLIYTNDPSAGPPSESNLMGRMAYLIINCSGLLDANYAGGASRGSGTNPIEIAIENLNEIAGKKGNFISRRVSDVRYETVGQLNVMGDFHKPATNMFVYSRALPGYWNTNDSCVGTQVNLSGSASNLINRMSEITNAFAGAGFTAYESGVLYSNLIDYVDGDLTSSNFEYCVENVPMINEIVVSNVMANAGLNYKMDTTIYFELWHPFVNNSTENFDLQYRATFTDIAVPPSGFTPGNIGIWTPLPPPLATPGARSFAVKSVLLLPSIILPPGNVKFKSMIDVRVVSSATGKDVDEVYSIELTNENLSVPSFNVASAECLDPRFNKDPGPLRWRIASYATLGKINTWVTNYWANNPSCDGDSAMYVANQPIRSVAELGYLVYSSDKPWHTVKLYGPNLHHVLDVFGLSTNTSDVLMTNTIYRGLVNCNPNVATDAAAIVFADMPVDEYAGGPVGVTNVYMPGARAIASDIFSGGICANLSDLGRSLTNFPIGNSELEKESYFRNAFNLFNLRQNMFTVIIEAQAASGGNIPRNPVKQRAVAIVWRDPYTGEMFVRHLKWLGD